MTTTATATAPSLVPAELQAHIDRIRMVQRFFTEGESGPTHLRYLERRPLDWGFWLVKYEEIAEDLEPLCTIPTLHLVRGNSHGWFQPTYNEYYAQIPMEFIHEIVAIEYNTPEFKVMGDMQEAQTTFYKRKS